MNKRLIVYIQSLNLLQIILDHAYSNEYFYKNDFLHGVAGGALASISNFMCNEELSTEYYAGCIEEDLNADYLGILCTLTLDKNGKRSIDFSIMRGEDHHTYSAKNCKDTNELKIKLNAFEMEG